MREFWWWIYERQNVWYRRMRLGQPRPWTKDPILRDYFFTNAFRELDKGTVYLLDKVHRRLPQLPPPSRLFNILGYRYFNNIETWEFITNELYDRGFVRWGEWEWKSIAEALTRREDTGKRTFTDAFTVTGVRFGGFADKVSNVCWLLEQIQRDIPRILKGVNNSRNLQDVFRVFQSVEGFGNFLAYEVTIDVNYPGGLVAFSEDDFVNPGPGCKRGLQYIFGMEYRDYVTLIKYLRYNQHAFFDLYNFTEFKAPDGKDLSLRSIEHSLCEFQKYYRVKTGQKPSGDSTIARTRKYTPEQPLDSIILAMGKKAAV